MSDIVPVRRLDLVATAGDWEFARRNRIDIDRHWQAITAENPSLWNGEVLLCSGAEAKDDQFSATLVASDYASFVAWRDWGRPDQTMRNCFGVPAVFSSDGALLFGVMNGWTLNVGKSYPPSGTLEPKDIRGDGSVDVLGSMRTELREETGLDLAQARAGDMIVIFEGPRLAIVQRFDFDLNFTGMKRLFADHVANEEKPELSAIEAVWDSSQIDSRMPGYAQDIVRYFHR